MSQDCVTLMEFMEPRSEYSRQLSTVVPELCIFLSVCHDAVQNAGLEIKTVRSLSDVAATL